MEFTHQGSRGRFISVEGSGHIRISPLVTVEGCSVSGAVQQLSGPPVYGDAQATYGGPVQNFTLEANIDHALRVIMAPSPKPAPAASSEVAIAAKPATLPGASDKGLDPAK